jgi:putative transposase
LPPNEADFSTRWRLIKSSFSRAIRDQRDFDAHLDYIHFNLVKHDWAARAADWPHASFHPYVGLGR